MKRFTKFFIVVNLLGMIISMMSCDKRTEEQWWKDYQAKREKARQDSITEAKYHGFQVIVIDSCEYLIKSVSKTRGHNGYGWGYMSHKGNCKFCEERRKQENHE